MDFCKLQILNMMIIFILSSLVSIISRIAFFSILVALIGKHNDLLIYF